MPPKKMISMMNLRLPNGFELTLGPSAGRALVAIVWALVWGALALFGLAPSINVHGLVRDVLAKW